jgi:hypothetical protein
MNVGRHQRAVIVRADSNPGLFVVPFNWKERRALVRMVAWGGASEVRSVPGLWAIVRREVKSRFPELIP